MKFFFVYMQKIISKWKGNEKEVKKEKFYSESLQSRM